MRHAVTAPPRVDDPVPAWTWVCLAPTSASEPNCSSTPGPPPLAAVPSCAAVLAAAPWRMHFLYPRKTQDWRSCAHLYQPASGGGRTWQAVSPSWFLPWVAFDSDASKTLPLVSSNGFTFLYYYVNRRLFVAISVQSSEGLEGPLSRGREGKKKNKNVAPES